MTTLQIDPRHRPLRGARAIARYLGGQDEQLTLRQLQRGMIDADRDGKLFLTTPARVDASPLIVGTQRRTAKAANAPPPSPLNPIHEKNLGLTRSPPQPGPKPSRPQNHERT